jgi:hypothetical protein
MDWTWASSADSGAASFSLRQVGQRLDGCFHQNPLDRARE